MITLQQIKTKQEELGALIAQFEGQTKTIILPLTKIELASDERYAGLILSEGGMPAHHLILLPGEAENINWKDAKVWAEKAGGELPSRPEQALLYANLKGEFKSEWYWSSEQRASYALYAWAQGFGYGDQLDRYVDLRLRARAVRRLVI